MTAPEHDDRDQQGGGLTDAERESLDVMGMFPTAAGLANPAAWEREMTDVLASAVERIVAARLAARERADADRLAAVKTLAEYAQQRWARAASIPGTEVSGTPAVSAAAILAALADTPAPESAPRKCPSNCGRNEPCADRWHDHQRDEAALPLHRTEAGFPNCSVCDGGGCFDCTDPA